MEELARILPVRVPRTLIGINASEQVGAIAKELGAKKVLIVTDAGVIAAGLIDGVKASLKRENIAFEVFDHCPTSAPLSAIHQCSISIEDEECNLIVGIGGGSVMDLAKLATIVAAHGGDANVLLEPNKIKAGGLPKIFLPTTSGTGSEWSNSAVFTNEAAKRKMPLRHDYLWADAAIIDPLLTLNLPPSVTADTGMDALSHAIEGYTSLKANIVADMFAEKAIQLIAENLRIAYARGSKHIESRYNMAIAAGLAMLAMRSSASYIVHSLSYPLGLKTGLSHGGACSLMLPYVMEFNLIGNSAKFARVAELMGESTEGLCLGEKAQKSVEAVKHLATDIGLPQRLGEVGVSKDDIPEVVDYIFTFHSYQIETNPRELTREDAEKILEAAL